jgi:prepilin-type N-terminal cleavage/methylation domain-containing protein
MRLRRARPRGVTLVELLVALAVASVLAAVTLRGLRAVAAREAVRAAAGEVRTAFATARTLAVARGARAAVRIDTLAGRVVVHAGVDTVWRAAPGADHGVRLAATRDSMAYAGGSGLGHGAANLRVVVRRGWAAETVVVARAGRVR